MMTDTHTRACYNGIGILLLVLQLYYWIYCWF